MLIVLRLGLIPVDVGTIDVDVISIVNNKVLVVIIIDNKVLVNDDITIIFTWRSML